MHVNIAAYKQISTDLSKAKVGLVAVSKTRPVEEILGLYHLGQKDFGENYVQELVEKYERLPKDIRWHFIGHLQTNKVKYIAPFVSLIQSVDSKKLLNEINKQAQKNNCIIDCLLQVHIAEEETKFGFNESELAEIMNSDFSQLKNIQIIGLMGMASLTSDRKKIGNEFRYLKNQFDKYSQSSIINYQFSILSMGMSADYKMAVEEGSNMVRIGSLLFGNRD